MAIFGAQGIRDAMIKSYHKYAKRPVVQGIAIGKDISLHQFCLYGALSSRYLAGFKSIPEVVIWVELAPFLELEPDDSLSALAEYIVYKEMPVKADVTYLSMQVKKGLSLYEDEDREAFLKVANMNKLGWVSLL